MTDGLANMRNGCWIRWKEISGGSGRLPPFDLTVAYTYIHTRARARRYTDAHRKGYLLLAETRDRASQVAVKRTYTRTTERNPTTTPPPRRPAGSPGITPVSRFLPSCRNGGRVFTYCKLPACLITYKQSVFISSSLDSLTITNNYYMHASLAHAPARPVCQPVIVNQ
ncbi:uncharacterized protein PpBr36_05861 [Pyricularia pennisetigena]|uniref:uncharacterized protein n=1 Tax=Pyricularia pennisetigena TaxID=1578925 RepID=UPI00114DE137|nr:uncharacterized protein PpBr36_05861 [Pyricularia pennisetigena]TLS22965.1 hypothetical protein PpBr36_05861 [Pyricularia pennisetigena]